MTNAEMIAEIRKLSIELNGDLEGLPGLTKLRKPALEQLLDGLRLNLAARATADVQDHRDGCECIDCDEFYEDDSEIAWNSDEKADREAIEFVREVSQLMHVVCTPKVNVTVTDVREAEVVGLVQIGSRLAWGKLIDVIRRGYLNTAKPDFLVTVEVDGVRRLVKADHYLAA